MYNQLVLKVGVIMDCCSAVAEISYHLLIYHEFNHREFSMKYDVNFRKIQRYIQIIRCQYYDMQLYHLEIVYSRSNQVYYLIDSSSP